MRAMYRGYRREQPAEEPVYHYDSGLRHLPIILLSSFGIATTASGLSLMIGASFIFGLLVSVTLSGMKLYFLLRYEPRHVQRVANRRDKVLGYVIFGIALATVAAFGLYGLGSLSNLAALATSTTTNNSITLMTFFRETWAKNTYAIVCWFIALIVEVIILIIVVRDHLEYEYYVE